MKYTQLNITLQLYCHRSSLISIGVLFEMLSCVFFSLSRCVTIKHLCWLYLCSMLIFQQIETNTQHTHYTNSEYPIEFDGFNLFIYTYMRIFMAFSICSNATRSELTVRIRWSFGIDLGFDVFSTQHG